MEKEFVLYTEALELKELGFDEPCFGLYDDIDKVFSQIHSMASVHGEEYSRLKITKAPTFSQAFRWFREKYGLWFRPDYYDEMKEYNFQGSIHELGKYSAVADIGNHKTPEEAELACLKKLIEIVKEK